MEAARIIRLLPGVYQQAWSPDAPDSVLAALLAVMEEMQAPAESFLDGPDRFFDAWRAPEPFLAALARWVGLTPYVGEAGAPAGSVAELRALTARAATLARSPGTADTIIAICELVTGRKGFVIESDLPDADGRRVPFHVRLVAPAGVSRALLETILTLEKPAFVTAEIVIRDAADNPDAPS
jgi:phage tail-like protein